MNHLGRPIGIPTRPTGRFPGPTDGRTDELTHVVVAERVEPTAPDAHEKSHLIEIATSTTTEEN